MKYVPPKVSRFFRYDWQFAVDRSKLPLLRPASLVVAFMPLISKVSVPVFGYKIISIPTSLWLTWLSSVAFLASWLILQLRCPHLVLQYQDFGQYAARKHSHRWIVWLFYNTIQQLNSWQTIVQETLAKGISVRTSDRKSPDELRQCPILVKRSADSVEENFGEPGDPNSVVIFLPVNLDRDIYLPIHCYGERVLLLLQEDDPKLDQKEKELFWILFSQSAKERPKWRMAFWALFFLSVGLVGWNVLNNVIAAIW